MASALLVNPSKKRRGKRRSSSRRRGSGGTSTTRRTRRRRRSAPRASVRRRRSPARRRYTRRRGFARATVTLRNPSRRRRSGGGGGAGLKGFFNVVKANAVPAGVVVVGLLGPAVVVDMAIQHKLIDGKHFVNEDGSTKWTRYAAEGVVVGLGWFGARKLKGGRYANHFVLGGLAGIGVRAYMDYQRAENKPDEVALATWGRGATLFAPKGGSNSSSMAGHVGTIERIEGRLGTIERLNGTDHAPRRNRRNDY